MFFEIIWNMVMYALDVIVSINVEAIQIITSATDKMLEIVQKSVETEANIIFRVIAALFLFQFIFVVYLMYKGGLKIKNTKQAQV